MGDVRKVETDFSYEKEMNLLISFETGDKAEKQRVIQVSAFYSNVELNDYD